MSDLQGLPPLPDALGGGGGGSEGREPLRQPVQHSRDGGVAAIKGLQFRYGYLNSLNVIVHNLWDWKSVC